MTLIKEITPIVQEEKTERTFYTVLLRTFGLTLCFTPYFGSVILLLSLMNLDWIEMVPYTFLFACIIFIVSYAMEDFTERRSTDGESLFITSNKKTIKWKSLIELLLFFLITVGTTLFFYYFIGLSMTMSVSIVCLLVPLLWLGRLGKMKVVSEGMNTYFSSSLPQVKNEVLLLISASFFCNAFVQSPYSMKFYYFLESLVGNQEFLLLLVISLFIIIFPILGFHPLILPSVFAAVLTEVGVFSNVFLGFDLCELGIIHHDGAICCCNFSISKRYLI